MSRYTSRQIANEHVKKWDQAIRDAEALLQKVESRAARLKGAIKTFTELREHGQPFNGPQSATDI
jgi:phage shock protein A